MNGIGSHRRLPDLRSVLVRAVVARLTRRVKVGEITIGLPSGERLVCSGENPGPVADIQLLKWRAILRAVVGGDVGLAASYCDGEWTSSDLPSLIEWAALNGDQFTDSIKGLAPARFLNAFAHRRNVNTRCRQPPQHRRPLRSRQRILPPLARPEHDLFLGHFPRAGRDP